MRGGDAGYDVVAAVCCIRLVTRKELTEAPFELDKDSWFYTVAAKIVSNVT